jgi:hypothetical protein
MAPHHGSARSRPRGFAEWSRPEWVAISGSRSRDASEVIDAYRSYGADVLHTAHDGAIRFIISPAGTTVETWHDGAWHERKHRGNLHYKTDSQAHVGRSSPSAIIGNINDLVENPDVNEYGKPIRIFPWSEACGKHCRHRADADEVRQKAIHYRCTPVFCQVL